jgi:hypothetical protein
VSCRAELTRGGRATAHTCCSCRPTGRVIGRMWVPLCTRGKPAARERGCLSEQEPLERG